MNHHPYPGEFKWGEENTADLKRLFEEGLLSCGQMAKQLGCPSRNAVIGKLHRLGLGRFTRSQTPSNKPVKLVPRHGRRSELPKLEPTKHANINRETAKARRLRAKVLGGDEEVTLESDGVFDLPADQSPFAVSFLDVTEKQCRWPLNEPGPGFLFCGDAQLPECSYCARHDRLAHTSSSGERPRSRMNLLRAYARRYPLAAKDGTISAIPGDIEDGVGRL